MAPAPLNASMAVNSVDPMYSWRVTALNAFLAEKEGQTLTVKDLNNLGHLDQYHYRGLQACDETVALLGLQPGNRLLDVGAGVGGPARYIADATGCSVTAVEILEDLSNMARVLNKRVGLEERIDWIHGDMCSAKVAPESCDAMMSLLVILHIADRKTLFDQIHAALKPGATFLIEDMVCISPDGVMPERPAELLRKVVHAPHIPNQAEYAATLEAAGFADVVFESLSASWRNWAVERHHQFEATFSTQVAKMGQAAADDRRQFYAAVAECFESGALGGVRITGRKLGAMEARMRKGRMAVARPIHPVSEARILELETARKQNANAANGKAATPEMPPFPQPNHDHLQFHFFVEGDNFVQARIYKTNTLVQAWAWCVVDGVQTTLFESDAVTYDAEGRILAHGPLGKMVFDRAQCGITIDGAKRVRIAAETVTDKRWGVPGQSDMVIHRPDLKASVEIDGVSRSAVGYSKRYFGPYPQHNIWRFIHGVFPTSAGRVFWTADATFGDSKYNYFKLVDGEDFYAADGATVYHQEHRAWAKAPFGDVAVEITPKFEHETRLENNKMAGRMREKFGPVTVTVTTGEFTETWSGWAMNEVQCGTLL